MAIIAVSSEGPNLDARMDPRFGRAAGFILVDPQTMHFEYVDNGASQVMAQGAGIQAAEIVSRAGANVVLTGFVGPKAFQALTAARIEVGQAVDGLTVRETLQRFMNGGITQTQAPSRRRAQR